MRQWQGLNARCRAVNTKAASRLQAVQVHLERVILFIAIASACKTSTALNKINRRDCAFDMIAKRGAQPSHHSNNAASINWHNCQPSSPQVVRRGVTSSPISG